jgi:hypothetical protein
VEIGVSGDRRPSLELRGYWQNPNLGMDDNGSISRAFRPDGHVYLGHYRNRPYAPRLFRSRSTKPRSPNLRLPAPPLPRWVGRHASAGLDFSLLIRILS